MRQKYLLIIPLVAVALLLSGCGEKEEAKEDVGYFTGMMDVNKQAQENIKKATDAENKRLSETLEEGDANNKSNAKNNMEYVKKYTGAVLKTSLGDIKVKFNNETTPVAVNNFLKLADEKFYDGVKFHRVIKGFMIQGGDPNSKTADVSTWGMGGPGYKFADELTGQEKYPQGTLAMANAGPNTNGSQFFIVTADPGYPLPPSYTVFGAVTSGLDVALKIENVKTGANDRPVEDVVIKSVELVK